MRLKIPLVDLRSRIVGSDAIEDEDTGKAVGALHYGGGDRTVSLFDGKYQATFPSHEECCAFAKGVQAVLNHMVRIKE